MWDYTDKVKDHFFNPRNVGVVDNADGIGEVGSLACGDSLKLTFRLGQDGRIAEAKFQTFGCGSAIATSSVLTEMIKGKTLEEAEQLTNRDIADYLGGLPEQKMHCSVMGHEALQAAIANYRSGDTKKRQLEGKVVCKCFGITEKEIERVVRDNNLKEVEDVTNYCKAGGGCQSCHSEIEQIIARVGGSSGQVSEASEETVVAMDEKPLTNIKKIKLIEQTLNQQIRPALQADGGDLELIDVVGDKVIVAFRGMCAQCNVAEFTMTEVVEKNLREFVSPNIIVEEQKQ